MTEEELAAIEARAENTDALWSDKDDMAALVAEVRRLRAHDREAVGQLNAAEADLRQAQAEVRRLRAHPLADLRSVERPGAFEGVYDQE